MPTRTSPAAAPRRRVGPIGSVLRGYTNVRSGTSLAETMKVGRVLMAFFCLNFNNDAVLSSSSLSLAAQSGKAQLPAAPRRAPQGNEVVNVVQPKGTRDPCAGTKAAQRLYLAVANPMTDHSANVLPGTSGG